MIDIVKADVDDCEMLTAISFAAKRHWNYPDHYYGLWKDELTITKDYIQKHIVYKAQIHNLTVGFYALVEIKNDFISGEILVKKGFYLEHIFILPEYHHRGIGRIMTDHAKKICKNLGIVNLMIFVDPYAKGFYDKIGAAYLYDSKSSIPGRIIPVYNLKISDNH